MKAFRVPWSFWSQISYSFTTIKIKYLFAFHILSYTYPFLRNSSLVSKCFHTSCPGSPPASPGVGGVWWPEQWTGRPGAGSGAPAGTDWGGTKEGQADVGVRQVFWSSSLVPALSGDVSSMWGRETGVSASWPGRFSQQCRRHFEGISR